MYSRSSLQPVLAVALIMLTIALPIEAAKVSASGGTSSSTSVGGTSYALTKATSGLVHYDPLTAPNQTINQNYWTLLGDAPGEGASYQASENATGLYIGVQSVTVGGAAEWAGFYTESPNSSVWLFHTTLTLPYSTLSSGYFNTGLYVQTDNRSIDYVTCAAQASSAGHEWLVVLAQGNTYQATSFTTLYEQQGGPLTQSCTIVTNGVNMLKVYLSGNLVYSTNSFNLKMPPPFNAYLEVETTVASNTMSARYNDYYDTLNDTVVVQDVPAGNIAELVGPGNTILGSGVAGANGNATITGLGRYDMPINATLEVLNSQNVLASTGSSSFWGGDVFALSLNNPITTSTVTVTQTITQPGTTSTTTATSTVTTPGPTTTVTQTTSGPTTTLTQIQNDTTTATVTTSGPTTTTTLTTPGPTTTLTQIQNDTTTATVTTSGPTTTTTLTTSGPTTSETQTQTSTTTSTVTTSGPTSTTTATVTAPGTTSTLTQTSTVTSNSTITSTNTVTQTSTVTSTTTQSTTATATSTVTTSGPTTTVTQTQNNTITSTITAQGPTATTTVTAPGTTSTVTQTSTVTSSGPTTTSTSTVTATTTAQGPTTTSTVTQTGPTTTVTSTTTQSSTATVTSTVTTPGPTTTITTPGPTTTTTQATTITSAGPTTTVTQTGPTTTLTQTVTVTGSQTTSTTTSTSTSTSTSTQQTSTITTTTTSGAGPSSLLVQSVNQYGNSITGYYTLLRTGSATKIGTGYTPMSFTGLTSGAAYSVQLESYGSCTFSHWQDTASTTDPRTFVANGALTLVGVYNCTGASPNAAPRIGGLVFQSGQLVVISAVVGSTLVMGRSGAKKAKSMMVKLASRSARTVRISVLGFFAS
jgi:hypothetical protein